MEVNNWADLLQRVAKMKCGENIVFTHKTGIYNLTKTEDVNTLGGDE